jgi:hypothetical protein
MGRGVTILIAGALLGSGFATVGCGEDSPSQAELREARLQGAQAARLRELERKLRQQERSRADGGAAPHAPPSPGVPQNGNRSSCGGDLTVGPNTSCPFAESVRSAYPGSDTPFEVYSSVTGQTYTMRCSTGSPHVCTGGNDASVYFP